MADGQNAVSVLGRADEISRPCRQQNGSLVHLALLEQTACWEDKQR